MIHVKMAKPIKEIPTLSGKQANKFARNMFKKETDKRIKIVRPAFQELRANPGYMKRVEELVHVNGGKIK